MAIISLTLTVEVPGYPDREIVENVIRDHVSMLCGFHGWQCIIAEDKPESNHTTTLSHIRQLADECTKGLDGYEMILEWCNGALSGRIAEDKMPDLADVDPIVAVLQSVSDKTSPYWMLDHVLSFKFTLGEIRRFLAWWNDVKAMA